MGVAICSVLTTIRFMNGALMDCDGSYIYRSLYDTRITETPSGTERVDDSLFKTGCKQIEGPDGTGVTGDFSKPFSVRASLFPEMAGVYGPQSYELMVAMTRYHA